MLVLTRKNGESIFLIKDDGIDLIEIEIKMVECFNNRSIIGITAPASFSILRQELLGRNEDRFEKKKLFLLNKEKENESNH